MTSTRRAIRKDGAALKAALKKQKTLLGKRRDVLRNIISEFDELADSCDRALGSLEDAIDALSEYV